jgi:hypothetical protein
VDEKRATGSNSRLVLTGQVTHSTGRIGYASGKLPFNRLAGEVVAEIAVPAASVRYADIRAMWNLPPTEISKHWCVCQDLSISNQISG